MHLSFLPFSSQKELWRITNLIRLLFFTEDLQSVLRRFLGSHLLFLFFLFFFFSELCAAISLGFESVSFLVSTMAAHCWRVCLINSDKLRENNLKNSFSWTSVIPMESDFKRKWMVNSVCTGVRIFTARCF